MTAYRPGGQLDDNPRSRGAAMPLPVWAPAGVRRVGAPFGAALDLPPSRPRCSDRPRHPATRAVDGASPPRQAGRLTRRPACLSTAFALEGTTETQPLSRPQGGPASSRRSRRRPASWPVGSPALVEQPEVAEALVLPERDQVSSATVNVCSSRTPACRPRRRQWRPRSRSRLCTLFVGCGGSSRAGPVGMKRGVPGRSRPSF
jgi:hypothetical protein